MDQETEAQDGRQAVTPPGFLVFRGQSCCLSKRKLPSLLPWLEGGGIGVGIGSFLNAAAVELGLGGAACRS